MILCRMMAKKRRTGVVPVYLNVYDLTPINGYAYWLGLGVYHSGIQVHGVEYGFGAHDHSTTGIFDVEPKQCPGFTFRKSILIGRTDMDPKQVRALMEKLSKEYSGNTYNLITKNCNHFCNDISIQLTGKPIPRWVNRLARLGLLCNCVLPAGLSDTKVRHVKPEDRSRMLKKKKLRRSNSTGSNRFEESKSSITTTKTTLSSSSCSSAKSASADSGRGRRQRRCIPSSTSSSSSSSSYSVTNSSSGTPTVV